MSNNKQSSVVDWIFSELIEENLLMIYGKPLEDNDLIEIIEQAKAMHKEEIMDAYHDGKTNGMDISHPLSLTKEISAEQYYNKTYGGNK